MKRKEISCKRDNIGDIIGAMSRNFWLPGSAVWSSWNEVVYNLGDD